MTKDFGEGSMIMFGGLANAVRFLSIAEVKTANSGHLGMPLGMADCLTVLFRNFLVFDSGNPQWPNRDRLILSGGHGSAALYALLYLTGYKNMSMEDLKKFRKLGSRATGHPEYNISCGVEATTGLLGQGIANAVGMAIEERLLNARLGDDCINHYTYACVGDGDLMEGISHEASAIAGGLSLGRLVVLFDDNNITIDGEVGISASDDVLKRYESYGWHTSSADGHSEKSISEAIESARLDSRPSIIACKTKIGYGSPRENTPQAHGGPLTDQEIKETEKKLNWFHDPFDIPEYIEKTWRIIGKRHRENCEKWYREQAGKYGAMEFEFSEEIRKVFRAIKKDYFISRPFEATRNSSKNIISKIMTVSDAIVSGSADLGGSTGCFSKTAVPISKKDFSGNYIHYGVREHAMGAIINGVAAGKKIKCFAGTFLAFSDYMRPAIRMSALMNIPSIFVFSHDSVGVGEDGPTHQPVEHLATLRAIPNLNVFRPADAMETLECWECAMKSAGPSVIILTRQDVLSVRFCGRANLCATGAYLLYDDASSNSLKVTLIATGSEVAIALEVKKMLNDINISANLVSLPCWKLFDEQPAEFKRHILGDSLRIGIEASNGFGWEKYLGSDGLFFGINNFGKSCSCLENYKFFGLTSRNICDEILKNINKRKNENSDQWIR
ncbi:MAG: transketolase [Holosporaceae bacterium]|jgi:transketolase|nr:transketolase [Holosporaceae bacterium]